MLVELDDASADGVALGAGDGDGVASFFDASSLACLAANFSALAAFFGSIFFLSCVSALFSRGKGTGERKGLGGGKGQEEVERARRRKGRGKGQERAT